jgi:hypothetical protein
MSCRFADCSVLGSKPSQMQSDIRCRSHHPVIHFYDDAGNVIETHEHAGDFKEPWQLYRSFRNRLRRGFAQIAATNEVQEWAEASATAWTLV